MEVASVFLKKQIISREVSRWLTCQKHPTFCKPLRRLNHKCSANIEVTRKQKVIGMFILSETGITVAIHSTGFDLVPWKNSYCLLACRQLCGHSSYLASVHWLWDVTPADWSWKESRPRLDFKDTEAHRHLKLIMINNSDVSNVVVIYWTRAIIWT